MQVNTGIGQLALVLKNLPLFLLYRWSNPTQPLLQKLRGDRLLAEEAVSKWETW
jgi:hypothetical protein